MCYKGSNIIIKNKFMDKFLITNIMCSKLLKFIEWLNKPSEDEKLDKEIMDVFKMKARRSNKKLNISYE